LRVIGLGLAAITVVVLCLAITPAAAGAQTPQPTPPEPMPGECGELAPESPAFAAPTDLTVNWGPLPDNARLSGALLSWRDNADNEACYVVERKGPDVTDWQEIIMAPSPNWENTDDSNFEAPGYYCYRVFAGSEAGRSDYSNEACLEVPEATVHGLPPGGLPPGAPPPGPPPTLAPVASATAAAEPAALPSTGSGAPSDNEPFYLFAGSLLAAGGVLASLAVLALIQRRRYRL
jgi:hypothetical protein